MSGVAQIVLGSLVSQQILPKILADTGIVERPYGGASHLFTINKGVSWSGLPTSGDSYGGMSSSNEFFNISSAHTKFNFDFSSSLNLPISNLTFSTSVARYHTNPRTGVIMRQGSTSIQRSTDGGATWTTVYTRSPAGSFSNGFHYGNRVWFHSWTDTNVGPRVVYNVRSADDGLTWSTSGITGLPNSQNFSGHSFFGNGFHYFSHPAGGLYRSADALTWTLHSTAGVPGTQSNYGQQGLPFFLDGNIYVTNSNRLINRSVDGGLSWSSIGTAAPASFGASGAYLAYLNGNWAIAHWGLHDGSGNDSLRIHTSSDNGATWTLRFQAIGSDPAPRAAAAYGLNQHWTI